MIIRLCPKSQQEHEKAFVFIKIKKDNSEKNSCPLIRKTLNSYFKMLLKINSFAGMSKEVFWKDFYDTFEVTQALICKAFFYVCFRTTQKLTAKAMF